ncbi:hypothetical protein GIB67_014397 [Kingdonia uniflora]|uniref:AB hydrolase-1 domain-containing protein n=1 Tax=Kingdonia uniflora TaxID=39325 RepID=A0A7J7LYY7_9MAGN|nr:hypothetical protein GIB67_014397 [Kingdonia uniflora]
MEVLARQVGYEVVVFDRPGWGLTSPPRKNVWEENQLPNPYKLKTQVDLLLSFCLEMGLSSVVLVGHDDGAQEFGNPKHVSTPACYSVASNPNSASDFLDLDVVLFLGVSPMVQIRGIVFIGVSLSREVIPAFARILLRTTLGKKHLVWPLLRTEITQVVNQRSWYDVTKLTTEVLNLYKVPLCVEGWDEALHEIGKLSSETFLSTQKVVILLKSLEDLPVLVLVVAGAEDALVSLKYFQVMASKLVNSVSLTVLQGPVLAEVHQRINPWICQVL